MPNAAAADDDDARLPVKGQRPAASLLLLTYVEAKEKNQN